MLPVPAAEGGSSDSLGDAAVLGVLTVSDRASRGEYVDEGGPAILGFFSEAIASPWVAHSMVVPDEREQVEQALITLADRLGCSLIVTTGGTGPAPRDITPEATLAVADRELSGFGERMRALSLAFVPTAILSRQVGATRGNCLMLNLPGRPKAIRETLDEIFAAVPYCIDLIDGPYIETHAEVVDAFRPAARIRS